MPRIGRTTTGEWHFLGKSSCGDFDYRELVVERALDETAYDGTPDLEEDDPETEEPPFGEYRNFCRRCYNRIEAWKRTRASRIKTLLRERPEAEPDWERGEHDPRKQALPDCAICDKPESGSNYNQSLDHYACDACREAFNEALRGDVETDGSATDQEAQSGSLSRESPRTSAVESAEDRTNSGDSSTESTPSQEPHDPPHRSSEESGVSEQTSASKRDVDRSPSNGVESTSQSQKETEAVQSNAPSEVSSSTEPSSPSFDALLSISGVGPKTIQTLRTHGYQTRDDIQEASPEELVELPGIGSALSKRLSTIEETALANTSIEPPSESTLKELKTIPGVGEKTITVLQENGYTSRREIAAASPSDLQALPQIGQTVAKRLVNSE